MRGFSGISPGGRMPPLLREENKLKFAETVVSVTFSSAGQREFIKMISEGIK